MIPHAALPSDSPEVNPAVGPATNPAAGTRATCVHHWRIQSPQLDKPTLDARCLKCPATRTFPNVTAVFDPWRRFRPEEESP